jgi:hypothetical protein
MPFKSQAQRRKFAQLLVEGKISNQTFEEWNRETGSKKLPERVGGQSHRWSKRNRDSHRGPAPRPAVQFERAVQLTGSLAHVDQS